MYNVYTDRRIEDSRVFKNNRLLYNINDKNSKTFEVPIKTSNFYHKPTLKFLEEKFKSNEPKEQSNKNRLKNNIQIALLDNKIYSLDKLALYLQKKGIDMVFRKSKDGKLYGITYVDHKTQSVFN